MTIFGKVHDIWEISRILDGKFGARYEDCLCKIKIYILSNSTSNDCVLF